MGLYASIPDVAADVFCRPREGRLPQYLQPKVIERLPGLGHRLTEL